jgi:hypothetical protein
MFPTMSDSDNSAGTQTAVTRVIATVHLQSSWRDRLPADGSVKVVNLAQEAPSHLSLQVSLSVEDRDGRRIPSKGTDFGMSGPRRGIWHRWHGPQLPANPEEADRIVLHEHRVDLKDIQDGINQMLGRDPDLHHPPRLAWHNLISALSDKGISVTEQDLIAVPLVVELSYEVQAELERP